jgi:hypothetical protein
MNIFYLDHDQEKAARMHCDIHVNKMIIETAQLLSSAHHIANSDVKEKVYKLTHKNHTSAVWTRASKDNYIWLLGLLKALISEFHVRNGKNHKTEERLEFLEKIPALPDMPFTQPTQSMPDIYRCDDSIIAYRNFYREYKWPQSWFKFKGGVPAEWLAVI